MIRSFSEPIKWKKHLKLVEFGLRTYEDLVSEIHRYTSSKLMSMCNDIKQELFDDAKKGEKAFYVIIIVANNKFFSLPNYRIYCEDDLVDFLSHIKLKNHAYDELWYCRTIYNDDNGSLNNSSGRILFEYKSGTKGQIVEQVWNRNPRVIEQYNQSAQFIYTRASRASWGHRYISEYLHIPKSITASPNSVINSFSDCVIKIERKRERLEIFEEFLLSFRCNVFSIEYKIVEGRLNIIDWDTPNDSFILLNKQRPRPRRK